MTIKLVIKQFSKVNLYTNTKLLRYINKIKSHTRTTASITNILEVQQYV